MKKHFYSVILVGMLTACASEQTLTGHVGTDPLKDLLYQQASTMPFFNQPAASVVQTGYLNHPNVQEFIRYQNQVNGLDIHYLQDFFARVQFRSNLIVAMDRPATNQAWYVFRRNNSGAIKISAGKAFYTQNKAIIDRAAAQYGVSAAVIVAILGIETHYGKNSGSIRVADSLATLAFSYPRRGAFFQQQLAEFLKMAQEERRDPFSFLGSFAGAMGMPQFMPTSFRQWSVDFNKDGVRNIWNSVPDTVASVGNYLRQHGWQTGKPIIVPVSIMNVSPQIVALSEEKTSLNYTVGQLRALGVMPMQPLTDDERAMLFRLESAPNQYDYFMGLNNFYTVWQYNHSKMYVTAVHEIAQGVSGER